jgi:3-dehydroquinate dehydratase/shikimate dehydrogenase
MPLKERIWNMSSRNRFCVSILPKNEKKLREMLGMCLDGDLIEIRCDYIRSRGLKLISQQTKPVIITIRTQAEGGFFGGSPTELIRIYQEMIDAGMDYIDISDQVADEVLPSLRLNDRTKLVLSCHSSGNNADSLALELDEMLNVRADVYKLVLQAESLNDNLTALKLMEHARRLNIAFVIHAQGEEGKLSRIIGSFRGNSWTYVSLTDRSRTALGQLSIQEAKHQFYLQEKNADTRLIGLVGNPVEQSRGWILYNRLFHLLNRSDKKLKVNTIYLNFPVKHLVQFWRKWEHRVDGLSVTIPHKEEVLRYADLKSGEVESSGVCNTLLKKGDTWVAYNVDLLAMADLLRAYKEQMMENGVLVFGTGATTRSAIAALQSLGVERIYLRGRNGDRGRQLAQSFAITFWEDNSNLPPLSAIIQTTSVGMYPNTDQMPSCAKYLKGGMLVFDVVSNPKVTRFLQAAKDLGCSTISGEEMYLHQATRQFELFTGVSISMDYLKRIWNEHFV